MFHSIDLFNWHSKLVLWEPWSWKHWHGKLLIVPVSYACATWCMPRAQLHMCHNHFFFNNWTRSRHDAWEVLKKKTKKLKIKSENSVFRGQNLKTKNINLIPKSHNLSLSLSFSLSNGGSNKVQQHGYWHHCTKIYFCYNNDLICKNT